MSSLKKVELKKWSIYQLKNMHNNVDFNFCFTFHLLFFFLCQFYPSPFPSLRSKAQNKKKVRYSPHHFLGSFFGGQGLKKRDNGQFQPPLICALKAL